MTVLVLIRGVALVVVLSERIADKVKMCEIRSEIYGASDHCPITMEIDNEVVGTESGSVTAAV